MSFLLPPVICDRDGGQDPAKRIRWRCPFCFIVLAFTKEQLPTNYLIVPNPPLQKNTTWEGRIEACYAATRLRRAHCEPWRANHPKMGYDEDYEEFEGSDEDGDLPF